jgi:hypothetical protein
MGTNDLLRSYMNEQETYNANRKAHMQVIVQHLRDNKVPEYNQETFHAERLFDGWVYFLGTEGSVSCSLYDNGEEVHWGSLTTGEWCNRIVLVEGQLYTFGQWSNPMGLPEAFVWNG